MFIMFPSYLLFISYLYPISCIIYVYAHAAAHVYDSMFFHDVEATNAAWAAALVPWTMDHWKWGVESPLVNGSMSHVK